MHCVDLDESFHMSTTRRAKVLAENPGLAEEHVAEFVQHERPRTTVIGVEGFYVPVVWVSGLVSGRGEAATRRYC